MVCRPAGALCPIMRPLPAPGMCFPESYGFRTVRRIGGYWVALGIGSVVLGMPTKVFVSTTADAGSWIDVTANLDVLNPANCATGVYVQVSRIMETFFSLTFSACSPASSPSSTARSASPLP